MCLLVLSGACGEARRRKRGTVEESEKDRVRFSCNCERAFVCAVQTRTIVG